MFNNPFEVTFTSYLTIVLLFYILSGGTKERLFQKSLKKKLFEMGAEEGAISNELNIENKRI